MTNEDYDKAYFDFHQRLLKAFIEQIQNQVPFIPGNSDTQDLDTPSQKDQDFLTELNQLPHSGGSEHLIQGQHLLCRIVATYPHLMPLLPRDLLWFFGGDCLHFMPDDEIAIFQRLDEQRQEAIQAGHSFSYEAARAKAMGLH